MKHLITTALLLALSPLVAAHGGSYSGPGKGPGDTAPPEPVAAPPSSGRPSSQPGGQTPPGQSRDAGTGANSGASAFTAGTASNTADDLTSWRYWWYYNSKGYLNLKRTLNARAVVPESDDFFLGVRHAGDIVGGLRPDPELIQNTIVPQLIRHLESESSQQVLTSALLSLSRLDVDAAHQAQAEAEITALLSHTDLIVVEVAAISLGIQGSDRSAVTLAALLAGGSEGRKLRGGPEVGDRVRAFAAYGLGQIGRESERTEVKRYVVSKLRAGFDGGGSSEFDLRIACLLSMGSVPLPSNPDYRPPTTGSLVASVCLESQVAWTTRVLRDKREDQFVRAHAPTTLARLLDDAERRGSPAAKAATTRILLELLKPSSGTPAQVMQSVALALGQLGDSDDDVLDRETRRALTRSSASASDQATRNFSLISLAQVAGRPGSSGAIPGAAPVRTLLVQRIERGATMQRPWAALAIGVLERSLADAGQPSPDSAAPYLRATLKQTRSPELICATAIALGILQDAGAESALIDALGRTSDTNVRGYAMIGLGLIQARGSLSEIEAILIKSKYRPELVQTAAVALALMHDTELVPKLIEMSESNASLPALGAICFSLGNVGDVRAAQALIAMSTSPDLGAVARGLAIEALGLVADRYELPWNTELSANTNYLANPTSLSDPDIVGVLDLF